MLGQDRSAKFDRRFVIEKICTAIGAVPETKKLSMKEVLRCLPYILTMGLAFGIAIGIGGRFNEGTPLSYLAAVGVAFVIGIPLGLLASLLQSPPFIRRLMWIVMSGFLLTLGVNEPTWNGFLVKGGVIILIAIALSLFVNRLSGGKWLGRL